jgi:hypothetical protein
VTTIGVWRLTAGTSEFFLDLLSLRNRIAMENVNLASFATLMSPHALRFLSYEEIWPSGGKSVLDGLGDRDFNVIESPMVRDDGAVTRIFLGAFSNITLGLWGPGPVVTIDPFSQAINAQVNITVSLWCSSAVRHPQAFGIYEGLSVPLPRLHDIHAFGEGVPIAKEAAPKALEEPTTNKKR